MPHIIWDFDNTLAYRPGMWSGCLAEVANARAQGANVTREQLAPHLSTGFPWHAPDSAHPHLTGPDAWWESLRPVLAAALVLGGRIDPSLAFEIAGRVRGAYVDPQRWVVFDDTEAALVALSSAGWRHSVLSNHAPELPQIVQGLGLGRHFDRVLTSATLGCEKPHPEAFRHAIAEVQRDGPIIMVGDSFDADYRGARDAGLDAILVRASHPECDLAFPDLRALARHLGGAPSQHGLS